MCALDNDLLFGKCFDLALLQLFSKVNDDAMTVVTGYRSQLKPACAECSPFLIADRLGGACHFTDVKTAGKIVNLEMAWGHTWDTDLAKKLSRIGMPRYSWMQHQGIFGNGVNGESDDFAVDFVGDGNTCH